MKRYEVVGILYDGSEQAFSDIMKAASKNKISVKLEYLDMLDLEQVYLNNQRLSRGDLVVFNKHSVTLISNESVAK